MVCFLCVRYIYKMWYYNKNNIIIIGRIIIIIKGKKIK